MDIEHQRSIVQVLAAKYPVFAVATIERWVSATIETYASARITTYIPVLVQRSVDATLSELARREGTSADALSVAELTDHRRAVVMLDLTPWPSSRSVRTSQG
jgi:hypothetical protein